MVSGKKLFPQNKITTDTNTEENNLQKFYLTVSDIHTFWIIINS